MRGMLLVAVLFSAAVAWPQDELLTNGGFEGANGMDGWGFVVWSAAPTRAQLDWAPTPRSGQRTPVMAGLENAANEGARYLLFSAPATVPEGLVKLTGVFRTSGAATAQIQVLFYSAEQPADGFRVPAAGATNLDLGEAPAWKPFAFDVNVGPGMRQMVLLLRGFGLGEVAFDDLSLKAVTDPLVLKLYPADYGRGVWPLVEGAPNFVRIMLIGDRARVGTDAALLLDLPKGVGDFGLLGTPTPVTHGNKPFTRYRLPLSEEVLGSLGKTVSTCGVMVWLSARGVSPDAVAVVRAVVSGQETAPQTVPLRVLPPLPDGPLPKRFGNFFCWSVFWDVPEKLWPDVYAMTRRIGVTHMLGGGEAGGWTGYLQDRLRAEGGHIWANVPHAFETETYQKGAETRIVAEGKAYFERVAGEHYRKLMPTVDGAFWDWEPANAAQNPQWDDPATVQAFAAKEGLPAADCTVERLQGEFRERFLKFRTWQQGELLRLWAAFLHDLKPDLTIGMCQGSGMPPDRGVDYRAYDDIPRLVHLPMIYTASPLAFAQNVGGMRGLVPRTLLFPMTSTSMVADAGWLAAKGPRAIYFDYVTSALQGCMGCSHWPDLMRGMDMEYVWEMARAMRDVGAVESLVYEGARNPAGVSVRILPESETRLKTAKGEITLVSPQWDRSTLVATFRLKSETLVAVCNMHPDKPATVLVREAKAGGARHAFDPVSGQLLMPDKGATWTAAQVARGVHFEVAPQTMGLLVLGAKAPAKITGRVRESDVRRRFAARAAAANAAGGAATVREGNLTINWEDVDGDGNAEVHVATPAQELGFGPSGNLWSWRVKPGTGELVNRFDGAGACQDRFWWPSAARSGADATAEYELVGRTIAAGKATVTFRRALADPALGGLVIEKTYSVPQQGAQVDVSVTFRNESPKPIEFSYWSHNGLNVGGTPALTLKLADGERTFAGPDQTREVWAAMPNPGPEQTPLLNADLAGTLAEAPFIFGPAGGRRLSINPGNDLLQLYRWWDGTDQARYTMEWMYQKQSLTTGAVWTARMTLKLMEP